MTEVLSQAAEDELALERCEQARADDEREF